MYIPDDPFLGTYYIGEEEEKAVIEVIKSKSLFRYQGPNLLYKSDELEKILSDLLGVKYVLLCNSGASALKLCCVANGIGPGDEVIMSPFTFIASANSVLSAGAIPVFSDIDESMNIDPSKIEEKITDRTKSIMTIHMQGFPCEMERIIELAEKYNLTIIEDVAQAFGTKINDKYLGTFGDCSAFSFQAGKTITCGEGGFFATNDYDKFKIAKMYHDNGGFREGCDYPNWINNGSIYGENYKITEIQSAIVIEQLKKLDMIVENQKNNFEYITNRLIPNKYNFRKLIPGAKPIYTSISFVFNSKEECSKFISTMNKKSIPFRLYCNNLIYDYDTFKNKKSWHITNFPYNLGNYNDCICETSQNLFKKVAWLNLSASLTCENLDYIINELNNYEK